MTSEERQAWMRVTAYCRANFKGVPATASLRHVEDQARSYFDYVRTVNKGTVAEAEKAALDCIKREIARLQGERNAQA